MVFPPQQAATDLDKKETSHIHDHSCFFPSPAEDERKECIQLLPKPQQVYSAAKTRSHGIAKLLYLQRALVPCLCKSGLHVVLSTLEKCFACVGDTMMCVCKFTNATLLHMLVPRRRDRAKPRVGRVERSEGSSKRHEFHESFILVSFFVVLGPCYECSCFNPNRLRKCSGRSRAGLRATSGRDGACIGGVAESE